MEYLIQQSTLDEIGDSIREKTETSEQIPVTKIAEIIRSISTGVELNFELVGGTNRPTDPVDNTIWVNTSIPITAWSFSQDEPASPIDHEIWIQTGKIGRVTFNMLKENCIFITALSSQQYVSGKWSNVQSSVYQNQRWVSLAEYLFSEGNEHVDITGGWTSNSVVYGNYTAGSFSTSDGTFSISCSDNSVGSNIYVQTTNVIDFTDSTTITINVATRSGSSNTTGRNGAKMFLTTTSGVNQDSSTLAHSVNIDGVGEYSIDLTDVSGSYYLMVSCYGASLTATDIYYY